MFDTVRKLLELLSPRDRLQLYLLLVFLLAMAIVEVAGIASIMPFMAVVTSPGVIHTNRWLNQAYETLGFGDESSFLIFLGFGVLGLLVVGNAIKATGSWLLLNYQNKIFYLLARQLLANYLARPYAFFLNRNTAQLGSNILTEARNVVVSVLSPAMTAVSSSLVAIAIMMLLVYVDPTVALAIFAVLGGAYGSVYALSRRRLTVIGEQQMQANLQKYKVAGEAMDGIKDLKVLGREWTFLERFAGHAERHARNNVTAAVIGDMPRYALEVVAFGGILLVVLYFLGRGHDAGQLVPLVTLYAFAGYRLMPALQQLFLAASTLRVGTAALDTLHGDLRAGSVDDIDPEAKLVATTGVTPLPFEKGLELRNISYRYEGALEPALRAVNLLIEHNATIGLVGPSGCGKTTTVDLILGLLSPSEGEILVDGTSITADNMPAWRRNIGYVPQQIFICDDTVTRNIALGVPDSETDMAAVRKAARIANLEEFVDSELPLGFDTVVGERGIRLSGGQRQRIGIARALYRDPAILIMDEATSALDGVTEENVMHAVRALSKRKTIILIAHRLTTVKDCDLIYLLDNGEILTKGKYEQLMHESRWFRAASRT
jgi:ABC-type multidrug transport system fused ATPase/permease subunit